jgi:hypothetical protein
MGNAFSRFRLDLSCPGITLMDSRNNQDLEGKFDAAEGATREDLKYWLITAYVSFLVWNFHSYGIRFLFISIHRIITKFL